MGSSVVNVMWPKAFKLYNYHSWMIFSQRGTRNIHISVVGILYILIVFKWFHRKQDDKTTRTQKPTEAERMTIIKKTEEKLIDYTQKGWVKSNRSNLFFIKTKTYTRTWKKLLYRNVHLQTTIFYTLYVI